MAAQEFLIGSRQKCSKFYSTHPHCLRESCRIKSFFPVPECVCDVAYATQHIHGCQSLQRSRAWQMFHILQRTSSNGKIPCLSFHAYDSFMLKHGSAASPCMAAEHCVRASRRWTGQTTVNCGIFSLSTSKDPWYLLR